MVHRLLIIVTSLVAENTRQGARALVAVAPRIWSAVSVVVVHGLSCLMVCGIFINQGSSLCPLHWQTDSLPLSHKEALEFLLYWFLNVFFSSSSSFFFLVLSKVYFVFYFFVS